MACLKWRKTLKLEESFCIAAPKRGELPYYGLQITYSDSVFSVRISSIWWFQHFISSKCNCLIIGNIRAEGEPTFKDSRKKTADWFIDKKYILYKYFVFKFQNMIGFE